MLCKICKIKEAATTGIRCEDCVCITKIHYEYVNNMPNTIKIPLSEDKEKRRIHLIAIENNIGVIVKIKNNVAFVAEYIKNKKYA